MANFTINDLMRRWYERQLPTADGGTAEGVVEQHNSVSAYGTATAPAANAAIVTIASGSLPAGYYEITAECSVDAGTPAAAERDNMEIRAGASVLKRIVMNPTASPVPGSGTVRRVLDGSTALTVNANGAATASVVYRASLTAVRLD